MIGDAMTRQSAMVPATEPMPLAHYEQSAVNATPRRAQRRSYRHLSDAERKVWMAQRIGWCCWGNLAAVGMILVLICFISEGWWVSAAMTYLPRIPYLIPSLVLILLSAMYRPDLIWTPVVSAILVLGPILGFSAPTGDAVTPVAGESPLRILSINLQEGTGGPLRVFQEIDQMQPDIVLMQETIREIDGLEQQFVDWNTLKNGEFFVASRFPIELVAESHTQAFDRQTAVLYRVNHPDGPFLLANLHLNTARHGLSELRLTSLLTGSGVEEFNWHQWQRRQEAAETRQFLKEQMQLPLIIAGDFNTPTTSSMYTEHWSDLQSAFEAAAVGYGYTVPCNTSHLWPRNTPWVRVDHILTSPEWGVVECRIGAGDGSDHRLISAELVRKTPETQ